MQNYIDFPGKKTPPKFFFWSFRSNVYTVYRRPCLAVPEIWVSRWNPLIMESIYIRHCFAYAVYRHYRHHHYHQHHHYLFCS